jgi:hypothetical protein
VRNLEEAMSSSGVCRPVEPDEDDAEDWAWSEWASGGTEESVDTVGDEWGRVRLRLLFLD